MPLAPIDWSVYLVTDRRTRPGRTILDVVRAAVQGGAGAVQLREKDGPARETVELGRAVLEITRPAGIPLIVNDRVDLALVLDAEGVHVGQNDLPAPEVRRLIGPDRWLGVSVTTIEQTRKALADGADYLGAGDVFGTASKSDAGEPIGLDGLREIVALAHVPVVAIGGVTLGNTPSVIRTGAAGVAVISAVFGADDPEQATRSLLEAAHSAIL